MARHNSATGGAAARPRLSLVSSSCGSLVAAVATLAADSASMGALQVVMPPAARTRGRSASDLAGVSELSVVASAGASPSSLGIESAGGTCTCTGDAETTGATGASVRLCCRISANGRFGGGSRSAGEALAS